MMPTVNLMLISLPMLAYYLVLGYLRYRRVDVPVAIVAVSLGLGIIGFRLALSTGISTSIASRLLAAFIVVAVVALLARLARPKWGIPLDSVEPGSPLEWSVAGVCILAAAAVGARLVVAL
jgi:hypothetical protein